MALHSNTVAYYTTPLIALTEQKFQEMQASAEAWGFSREDVGLVTGNRKVNPNARVLVVVAEILLNRLLHAEGFDFEHVSAVVMDEFHSFADPERGIVWELSLNMLPKPIRLLLLSATVGNSVEFIMTRTATHQAAGHTPGHRSIRPWPRCSRAGDLPAACPAVPAARPMPRSADRSRR